MIHEGMIDLPIHEELLEMHSLLRHLGDFLDARFGHCQPGAERMPIRMPAVCTRGAARTIALACELLHYLNENTAPRPTPLSAMS